MINLETKLKLIKIKNVRYSNFNLLEKEMRLVKGEENLIIDRLDQSAKSFQQ